MPGDAKIKSWHDGLFKSGLAMSAAAGPIRAFQYSTEQPFNQLTHHRHQCCRHWKKPTGSIAEDYPFK
jgi:hypothetical protein